MAKVQELLGKLELQPIADFIEREKPGAKAVTGRLNCCSPGGYTGNSFHSRPSSTRPPLLRLCKLSIRTEQEMRDTTPRNTRPHHAMTDTPAAHGKLLLELDSGRVVSAQVIIGPRQIDIAPSEVQGTVEIDLKLIKDDSEALLLEAAGTQAQPVVISTYESRRCGSQDREAPSWAS